MNLVADELVHLNRGEGDYVFHVPTSSFYSLDGDSKKVLDGLGAQGATDEDELTATLSGRVGLDEAEVGEIVADLVKLRLVVPEARRGDPGRTLDAPPESKGIRNLVLHVAHACNLACGYCYAEQGLYKGNAMLLTEEKARGYIDWLWDQRDPDVPQLGITFFGGEPLLNFPVVKAAAEYARQKAADTGQSVRFGITTNGTLITEEIAEFLEQIGAVVTVSLDAVGKTNDRLRPFHSGRGSYDLILQRIRPLLDRRIAVARATITKVNLDVVKTVETLLDEGFVEVGCSPVDAKNPAYDLDGADYAKLLEGFQVLTKRYVDAAAEGRKFGWSNIANILKAVHNGHNKEYPCGAGLQMVAASPDGKLSLCHRFVGEEDFQLGTLEDGLDEGRRTAMLAALNLKERSDCSKCWARYVCSGGCHHVNFLFTGDPAQTYLTHCDWLRAWYKTGLEAYAEILERNPDFIRQFIDPGWVCRN